MFKIDSIFKYIVLVIWISIVKISFHNVGGSSNPDIVLMVIPPHNETNQKTLTLCAGVMLNDITVLTSANCASQVRRIGPHAQLYTVNEGIKDYVSLHTLEWNYHKYYDGKNINRDLAIVEIVYLRKPIASKYTLTTYCSYCFDYCYTAGWGTFEKSNEKIGSLRSLKFGNTSLKISAEELVTGSSSDISAIPDKNEILSVDTGSPLFCSKKRGNVLHTGLVGILLGTTADGSLKFRTFRGLLTWASEVAMGSLIAPDGYVENAYVCRRIECDVYDGNTVCPSVRSKSSHYCTLSNHLLFCTIISSMKAL